jgi:hypothetical protein
MRVKFFVRSQTFTIFGSEMRVAVFFACLCILLLKGYDYVHAATRHHNICYTPPHSFEKTQQAFTEITDADYDQDEEYFVSDDVEDEDPNSLFARKYRLLARCNIIPSYLFISHYLYSCPKARLSFCSALSYIYITQKVLRI